MRQRTLSFLLFFASATCAAGCASHHAYPGEPRPASQVAVVVPAYEPGSTGFEGSPMQEVRLLRISGAACPQEVCAGEMPYAFLLPGAYSFDVGYRRMHHIAVVGLFELLVPDRDLERRISFSVEAGKKYEIYFDPMTSSYSVFVWNQLSPILDAPERPGFQPPFGASACVPPASTVAPPACSSDR